jgi:hypothetical protein
VAAGFRVHAPLDEVLMIALGESADAGKVAGESRDTERDGGRLGRPRAVRVLVIEPDGRAARVGEPVERDIGQDEVGVEPLVAHRVGGHELGVPAEQAGRRVGESVRQGLRLLRLQLVERDLAVHEPLQLLHRSAILGGHARELGRIAGREREDLSDVHRDNVLRVSAADLRGDHRPGVVARGAVALIAQAAHQRGPGGGGAPRAPAPVLQRGRERESRKRGNDQVERDRGNSAVRPWVGQRADQVQELEDRARPAVGQDQRDRVGLG